MVEFNRKDRTIRVKIAYYGPAVGGKTTNLKVLYDRARRGRRGEFVSVNSQQDRTILCDLLPLKSSGFMGYDLRFQLAAVPGQAIYAPARRVVLRGSDGVVFVANSATDRWHENQQCLRELQGHLLAQQLDPATIPMVMQYNKRDLPDVMEFEALNRGLNSRRCPHFGAVATRGEGVLETFAEIVLLTLQDLSKKHAAMALAPGESLEDWTGQAIRSMFGSSGELAPAESSDEMVAVELPGDALSGDEAAARHLLKLSMPDELVHGVADARSSDMLAESYAQASAELGGRVNDLREERDVARSRLAELKLALELAEQPPSEGEVEDRAQRILSILMRAADASGASLLLTTTDPPQILVLPPLVSDPLARSTWGAVHLYELRNLAEARLEEGSQIAELKKTLAASEPAFDSVALVPLRSAERVLALALLYYGPHMTLPRPDVLDHLGFLGRILAGPLEAAAAREAKASVDRMRAVSRASAAAIASLLTRLPGNAARRASLSLEDVLAPLRVPGVTVTIAEGTPNVTGDPALLRFGIATLIARCEAAALERSMIPVIGVYAGAENGQVNVHVWVGEAAAAVGAPVVTEAFNADADAEMSAVYAIMALHSGGLALPESQGAVVHYVLQLSAA
jgi:signal recognition particle receptor subunit beta